VLKLISSSTFDLQAVLDTLVETATRLCRARRGLLFRRDGDLYRSAAYYGYSAEFRAFHETHPIAPGRGTTIGRTALEGKTIHIPDVLADPEYTFLDAQKLGQYRANLGVPLLREGKPIGALSLARSEPLPFSVKQIELVEAFAAQAVIAIENTRLLSELRESLDQQTATSEVLQVISGSPGELQPVFDAMLANATRICDAKFATLYLRDAGAFRAVAATDDAPLAYLEARKPGTLVQPPSDTPMGCAAATKKIAHVIDVSTLQSYRDRNPFIVAAVELGGFRTILGVPMLKKGDLIGVITVNRQEVRPFTDKQVEFVKNFAAQAVIAIDNARLLNDLNKLNEQLETRVADQVSEIERMGRLRRFLPPQVADLIVASGAEKQLESHRREITALFCDLRGFTGFSESSDPEDVMALLREYHAAIGGIINKYGGTLERYAGDGVMVVFNDPIPIDNPAIRAVRMAIDMRAAIGELTEKWRKLGHDIGFGIGIAHGFATLGTIGFEGRFDYAAIGTVSNVASRLCDEAEPGQILISPRVLMAVENDIMAEPVGDFALKGIRRPLTAYNVLGTKAVD